MGSAAPRRLGRAITWIAASIAAAVACGRADFELDVGVSEHPRAPTSRDGAGAGGRPTGDGDASVHDNTGGRIAGDGGSRDASADTPLAVGDVRAPDMDARSGDADVGAPGDADAGRSLTADAGDPLVGSYDVYGDGQARLDIERGDAGYRALVTAYGGHPTEVPITVTDTGIEITGPLTVILETPGPYAPGAEWVHIVAPRLPDGHLDPHPTVAVMYASSPDPGPCDGIIDDLPLPVSRPPRLVPDVTPAQVSLGTLPDLGWLLPWDVVRATVSEGVASSSLLTRLSLVRSGTRESVGSVTWADVSTPTEAAWNMVVRAEGRATDWDAIDGQNVEIVAAAGIPDRAGNLSAEFVSTALSFTSTGPAQTAFDFDAPTTLAVWGAAAHLVAAGTPEASVCESGGCAVIGAPFWGSLGIAGRLAPPANASELRVRYRFVSSFAMSGSSFSVEVVRPGQASTSTSLPLGTVVERGGDAGILHLATEWSTLVVPLPPAPPGMQVGFRITSSGWPPCVATNAMLVVDSIEVQ